ncbi:unnamed protein product, partial [Owenia fusiformis]
MEKSIQCFRQILQLLVILVVHVPSSYSQTCQQPLKTSVPGDVIIGALFNMHEKGIGGTECSGVINPSSIQRLEAAMFAVKKLNDANFIRGVKFGLEAFDTCGNKDVALRRAMSYLASRQNLTDSDGDICPADKIFPGVIGPMYGDETKAVGNLLNDANVAQVALGHIPRSIKATGSTYSLSVVPRLDHISEVIISIITAIQWQGVAVVVDMDSNSRYVMDQLMKTAGSRDICIHKTVEVNDLTDDEIEEAVEELSTIVNQGVTGVVMLTNPETTFKLFKMVEQKSKSLSVLTRLQWITPFGFEDSFSYHDIKSTISGIVTIEEYSGELTEFYYKFVGRRPRVHITNPWFKDYWEQQYDCLVNVSCTISHHRNHTAEYHQHQYVSQTVTAVYTYAHALKKAHTDICGANASGLCKDFVNIAPQRLLAYLKTVEFVGLSGQNIKFDEKGDLREVQYRIKNVQTTEKLYEVKLIGSWTPSRGLVLNSTIRMYQDGNEMAMLPPSQCKGLCTCSNSKFDNRRILSDGDVLLAGIFDIHMSGSVGD